MYGCQIVYWLSKCGPRLLRPIYEYWSSSIRCVFVVIEMKIYLNKKLVHIEVREYERMLLQPLKTHTNTQTHQYIDNLCARVCMKLLSCFVYGSSDSVMTVYVCVAPKCHLFTQRNSLLNGKKALEIIPTTTKQPNQTIFVKPIFFPTFPRKNAHQFWKNYLLWSWLMKLSRFGTNL